MNSPMGYIKLARGWLDHPELFTSEPYTKREAWAWLIEQAAYADHRKRVGSAVVDLKRGQLAASVRFMAKAWRWEPTRVQRFFKRLKSATMITTDSATDITIVSICNYSVYQGDWTNDATPIATASTTDALHQRHKREKGNQGNNIDSRSANDDRSLFEFEPEQAAEQDPFEVWWKFVPRKVAKAQARRAFAAALKRTGSLQVLIEGIRRFAATVAGTEDRFIAHPATWLNGDRWLDQVTTQANHSRSIDDGWEAAKAAGPEAMDAFIARQRGKS